ncbi:MAG: SUMF1/EgtB/PvdO family nonheme iron enzyme [Planctomycetes bacterium]|nr:SUMF1/EgtB/PvdO family nonheme iron enzyme [Planctomycetota bacterium]
MGSEPLDWVWSRLGDIHRESTTFVLPASDSPDGRLLRALVRKEWIDEDRVREALAEQERMRTAGEPVLIEQVLLRRGWVTAEKLAQALKEIQGGAAAMPERLGRYELRGELGRGGMGTVYRAYDPLLKREVAVKLLRREEDAARVQREAQAAARLQHPNIVTVFDVGRAFEGPYLAMELVEGRPLHDAWKDWTVRRKVEAVEAVARAISYAHQKGVVHRDLKPGNVMVTPHGEAKVLDLGLARIEGAHTMTREGDVFGTPAYMAPEQLLGQRVAAPADIYALGVMLYEGLTGCLPYGGDRFEEICVRILYREPIRPRLLEPDLPRDLEVIALKAMEKEASRRFASAEEFAEDMRRWREGEPIRAKPPSFAERTIKLIRRHRLVSALCAVILLGVLGLLGYFVRARILVARYLAQDTEESIEKARRLDPDSREVERKWNHHRATRLIRDGHLRAAEYRREWEEVLKLRLAVDELEGQERQFEQDEKLGRAQEKMEVLFEQAVSGYVSALSANPDDGRAMEALARLYFDRYVDAEKDENPARASEFRELARRYDRNGAYVPRFTGKGWLTVETTPPGARAVLYRYEDDGAGRLVLRDERPIDQPTPIRSLDLVRGSYLMILKADGKRDTRLHLRIERDQRREMSVPLFGDDEIGTGFAYVPAGSFDMGGDPRAMGVGPLKLVGEKRFFISKYETQVREYAAFIRSLLDSGRRDEAFRRLPKGWRIDGDRVLHPFDAEDWPVRSVTSGDAEAYCRWMTERDTKAVYSLPTEAQWEKAARGVDRRCYPWGNGFVNAYCCSRMSSGGQVRPVGSFPDDVSPYGVFDMAGSMLEWCAADPEEDDGRHRAIRGGCWQYSDARDFRCAGRDEVPKALAEEMFGFRVVRKPR